MKCGSDKLRMEYPVTSVQKGIFKSIFVYFADKDTACISEGFFYLDLS